MHNSPTAPPMQAIARLVCLYRIRGLSIHRWASEQVEPGATQKLVKSNIGRMRMSLALGRYAHRNMGAPVAAAGAAAYLLLDAGNDPSTVKRFLAPEAYELAMDTGDPRRSLRRVMELWAGSRDEHHEHEALAYILRAWNLWVTGADVHHLQWTPHDGMPPIRAWPVSTDVGNRPSGNVG